jgi:hypothetical protein
MLIKHCFSVSPSRDYRGFARDVINDVTNDRRHIGGIFLRRTGRFNVNNVRKRWNVSIGLEKRPFSNIISIKMSRAVRKKYLQHGGRPSITSLQVLYM